MSEYEAELVGLTLIKNLLDDDEAEQIMVDSIELIQKQELDLKQAKGKIKLLEAQIVFVEKTSIAKQVQADKDIQVARGLISAASCPCCDGSGAYYDGLGEVCQCQWCYEKKELANRLLK